MSELDHAALQARNHLLTLFILLMVLDVILVVVSRDLWAIGRVVVTIAVMYFVLQGHQWAKWVLLGILSLVVVLLTALIILLHAKLSSFLVIGSLVMIILTMITAFFMLSNQNLKRYFAQIKKTNQ